MRAILCVAFLGLAGALRRKSNNSKSDTAILERVGVSTADELQENYSSFGKCASRPIRSGGAYSATGQFTGPTCETLSPTILDSLDSLIDGARALLSKREELQEFNNPTMRAWNTSALTSRELEEDKKAVENGFRPPGGSYSHPNNKWMGSYCQPITHATPGGQATKTAVNAKTVAQNLMHTNGNSRVCSDTVNQWFAAWIQLNVEDWIRGDREGVKGRGGPNIATAWWDMDSTYGTGYDAVQAIRLGGGGLVDADKLSSKEDIGQWVGISALKYALAMEHNLIASKLGQEHRDWDDDKLFGTARLITTAVVARIHTLHWTTILLQAEATKMGQITLWDGLVKAISGLPSWMAKTLGTIFSIFSDRNTMNGIVGGTLQKHYDFAWPEEFGLVYRLHPMLPDSLRIGGKNVNMLQLAKHANQYGYEKVANGMSEAAACALTLQNFPDALTNMVLNTGGPAFDLAEHDVIATRNRGLGSFNDFRRGLHLDPATSFTDLVTRGATPNARDQRLIDALSRTYDNIEDVDAVIGMFAEPRLAHSLLGISQYLVFVRFTQTRLESDPFYTEKYDTDHYTYWGLQHIKNRTFAGILGDHLNQRFESNHEWAGFMAPGWKPE